MICSVIELWIAITLSHHRRYSLYLLIQTYSIDSLNIGIVHEIMMNAFHFTTASVVWGFVCMHYSLLHMYCISFIYVSCSPLYSLFIYTRNMKATRRHLLSRIFVLCLHSTSRLINSSIHVILSTCILARIQWMNCDQSYHDQSCLIDMCFAGVFILSIGGLG